MEWHFRAPHPTSPRAVSILISRATTLTNHANRCEATYANQRAAVCVLIRLVVGGVFLSEGIQKFLYPAENGAGRLARIGIPSPEVMGPFVGVVEIVCGALSSPVY